MISPPVRSGASQVQIIRLALASFHFIDGMLTSLAMPADLTKCNAAPVLVRTSAISGW